MKLVKTRTERGSTQAELARVMGCQSAYFSQVLRGKVELTEDHGVKLSAFIGLSAAETDYFLLLLRQARAAGPELRAYLERQRLEILQRRAQLESRISSQNKDREAELALYYSADWIPSAIHIATSCPSLQTVEKIAQRFSLSPERVQNHLERLNSFHLVEFKDRKWRYLDSSIHFSRDSDVDPVFQKSRRQLVVESLSRRTKPDLHYAVVFACTEKSRQELREKFLVLIEELHLSVERSPAEEVFSVAIDLFKV